MRGRERARQIPRHSENENCLRRRGQWDSAAWTINLSDTPPTRQMWQALRCTAVSAASAAAASATVAASASSSASSRVAAINFHTQTTQLQLVSLATCRARLPHVAAAVAAAAATARCKRANKLRIDLCDLWHSSKINLNKRSVLVSTLSSLSWSAHLSLPFWKMQILHENKRI